MRSETYTDRDIVRAILAKNSKITVEYLYGTCYPLFKSIFDRYYTDCENCREFINEIYMFIMTPGRKTGVSKLSAFTFRCTLTMWLKIVAENYCRQIYTRRGSVEENFLDIDDRNNSGLESLEAKIKSQDSDDLWKILNAMTNDRFRRLIIARYIDEKSNEETAELLGVTMANYYNMHRRAKDQFCFELKREGLL